MNISYFGGNVTNFSIFDRFNYLSYRHIYKQMFFHHRFEKIRSTRMIRKISQHYQILYGKCDKFIDI